MGAGNIEDAMEWDEPYASGRCCRLPEPPIRHSKGARSTGCGYNMEVLADVSESETQMLTTDFLIF